MNTFSYMEEKYKYNYQDDGKYLHALCIKYNIYRKKNMSTYWKRGAIDCDVIPLITMAIC